jgi:hypothetical protein
MRYFEKKVPAFLVAILILPTAITGCAIRDTAEQARLMSPAQLQTLSDLQMCQSANFYQNAFFSGGATQDFINEFNRRGIICGGDIIRVVGYTQQRLDANDDATCQSYGIHPATDAYANCRLQLRAQRVGAAQAQQAQQDANQAAAWQNLSTTGAVLMPQSQPRQPTITNCSQFGNGFSCITP